MRARIRLRENDSLFGARRNGRGFRSSSASRQAEVILCARADGRVYRTSRKSGYFIMSKMHPKTPGTDAGWVYRTVSANSKKVLSAGKLQSCMKCHQEAPRDRIFGL